MTTDTITRVLVEHRSSSITVTPGHWTAGCSCDTWEADGYFMGPMSLGERFADDAHRAHVAEQIQTALGEHPALRGTHAWADYLGLAPQEPTSGP